MMSRTVRACAVAVLVAGAIVTLAAQTLDLRLGQWEFTMTIQPSEAELAKMPPPMRAQMEAMAKKPMVTSDCVTIEDLKEMTFQDDDKACKVTASKVTRTTADVSRRCEGPAARTETVSAVASSRESVRATMTSVTATGTQRMSMSGKWIADTCKSGQ